MKNTIITIALVSFSASAGAQTVNWQAFKTKQKHIAHLQAGFDYGLVAGIGYGYKFNLKMPVLANIEYSIPAGERLSDDFKIRLGGQMEVIRLGGFSATAKIYCPFRRFENSLVLLTSFGAEVSGTVGFYKKRWFAAAEFGKDKAIATHVRHLPEALEIYPGAQSGWYVPTGGNYFYGLQTGVSFGPNDLSLKAGKLISQGFKQAPFIPKFAQLGYSRRF